MPRSSRRSRRSVGGGRKRGRSRGSKSKSRYGQRVFDRVRKWWTGEAPAPAADDPAPPAVESPRPSESGAEASARRKAERTSAKKTPFVGKAEERKQQMERERAAAKDRMQKMQREQAAAGSKSAPLAPAKPLPQHVIQEASFQAAGGAAGVPLHIIRAKVPWRNSNGGSCTLHPLRRDEFWEQNFGRHAFALLRGPRHRAPVQMSTASTLLRTAKVGVNADVIGPYLWAPSRRPLPGDPNLRGPASAAIARGNPVRIAGADRLLRRVDRDPLFLSLARLGSVRAARSSIYWTPPGASALPPHEEASHQLVVQLHGARRWTVCSRGRAPPATALAGLGAQDLGQVLPQESKRPGLCTKVMLRRGDALYLPSMTWHWTDKGASTGVHITWDVAPLIGADLLDMLGGSDESRRTAGFVPNAALGLPLPLWHARPEDSVAGVVSLCKALPQGSLSRGAELMCTVPLIRLALQRLSATLGGASSSGDRAKRDQSTPAAESQNARASADKFEPDGSTRKSREKWRKKKRVLISVGWRFAEVLAGMAAIVLIVWTCCGEADADELEYREKRPRQPSKPAGRRTRGIRARLTSTKPMKRAPPSKYE